MPAALQSLPLEVTEQCPIRGSGSSRRSRLPMLGILVTTRPSSVRPGPLQMQKRAKATPFAKAQVQVQAQVLRRRRTCGKQAARR